MEKKRNVVARAKRFCIFILVLAAGCGWAMAAYTMMINTNEKKQGQMIQAAKVYLEDKLYIRAARQYQEALASYHTERNPTYETELLEIYWEGGMKAEYDTLLDDRIDKKTAASSEYAVRARSLIEAETASRAMEVLKQGIELFGDQELIDLYEQISYTYRPVTTHYTRMDYAGENGFYPAYNGEKWGYVNERGRTVLDFIYEEATAFDGKYAVVKVDGVYTLIDERGYWNAVDKNEIDFVKSVRNGVVSGKKDGGIRIYTNTFQPMSDEIYEDVCPCSNGLIAVKKDGRWALLDQALKPITDYVFTDMVENSRGQVFEGSYGVAADESGYFLINRKGEACFEQRFADAKGMEGGLFAVADSQGKWGFADETGELVVECQYGDVCSFSNRMAAVNYAGKWGYINRYNAMVIEPLFEEAAPFYRGRALVKDELGNYKILSLDFFELF